SAVVCMALCQGNDGRLLRSLSGRSSGGSRAASNIAARARTMIRMVQKSAGLSPAASSHAMIALFLPGGVVPGVSRLGVSPSGELLPLGIGHLNRTFLASADLRRLLLFFACVVVALPRLGRARRLIRRALRFGGVRAVP